MLRVAGVKVDRKGRHLEIITVSQVHRKVLRNASYQQMTAIRETRVSFRSISQLASQKKLVSALKALSSTAKETPSPSFILLRDRQRHCVNAQTAEVFINPSAKKASIEPILSRFVSRLGSIRCYILGHTSKTTVVQ